MDAILITGVGGVVGSAAAEHFHAKGFRIIGIDNDLRGTLLNDPKGSTLWNIERLQKALNGFTNHFLDVRDMDAMSRVISEEGPSLHAIIHCAAQPAHEGSVREDFQVNAVGTLNLLELWHRYCPQAAFAYASTIKVYGDFPNTIEYQVKETRFDLEPSHRYYRGFDENVPIGQGMSSFFGRSKTAADFYVQEYAHQSGLRALCFRASCLTGGLHSGTEAHGMLSYMMRCAYTKTPYHIYGYEGLQVRDQLHADDLVRAIEVAISDPRSNIVYNIGGGRENSCSILEAIQACEEITGSKMEYSFHGERTGDHRWWITDNSRFLNDHPEWEVSISLADILQDIYDRGAKRWA